MIRLTLYTWSGCPNGNKITFRTNFWGNLLWTLLWPSVQTTARAGCERSSWHCQIRQGDYRRYRPLKVRRPSQPRSAHRSPGSTCRGKKNSSTHFGLTLRSGVMVNGVISSTEEGTVEGISLSPLLSNMNLSYFSGHKEERIWYTSVKSRGPLCQM